MTATRHAGTGGEAGDARTARRTGIITPEAVVLEFETAGVASRLLARLIDGVVLWIGLFAMGLFLSTTLAGVGGATLGIIVLVILVFFVVFGYWMLLETMWRGRTIGKAAMGLRVVTVEGAPVRFRHAAIRAIVGVVDFLVPPLGPVAVISVLVSPRDQRLGDLAAGTIVLRERHAGGPATILALTEPAGREALMASLAHARLSDGQYNVLRRFLLRADALTPAARAQLAERIAAAVERSTGVPRPFDLHPEWYLHAAGLAHQRRSPHAQLPNLTSSQPPPPSGGRRDPGSSVPPPPPTVPLPRSSPPPPPPPAPR